jgi:tetrapyrrole methylase family protein/MazG family protein
MTDMPSENASNRVDRDAGPDASAQFDPSFQGLMALVGRLRGPGGCPWDAEQTRETFRDQFLEEAYELIEAVDEGDPDAIAEEVGDVLLHAAFQIQLGVEEGSFTDAGVFAGLLEKLVRRHPHVFKRTGGGPNGGDWDAERLLANWDDIKRAEKPAGDRPSAIDGVPSAMPSLAGAQRLGGKAARTGFDWNDISGILDKVQEEIAELKAARTPGQTEAELGDLLFSLVNLGRWLDIDAETALRKANQRFAARFRAMEKFASERGADFKSLTLSGKEALWQEAKAND